MKKEFPKIEAIVLVVLLLVLTGIYFLTRVNLGLSPTGAKLKVYDVKTTYEGCSALVSGFVLNEGEEADNIVVECNLAAYPLVEQKIPKKKEAIGLISLGENKEFLIRFETNCKESPRFECVASCENC